MVLEQWPDLKNMVKKALKKVEKNRKSERVRNGGRGWWCDECRKKRRKVRRKLREWRNKGRRKENINWVRKNSESYAKKKKRMKNGRG